MDAGRPEFTVPAKLPEAAGTFVDMNSPDVKMDVVCEYGLIGPHKDSQILTHDQAIKLVSEVLKNSPSQNVESKDKYAISKFEAILLKALYNLVESSAKNNEEYNKEQYKILAYDLSGSGIASILPLVAYSRAKRIFSMIGERVKTVRKGTVITMRGASVATCGSMADRSGIGFAQEYAAEFIPPAKLQDVILDVPTGIQYTSQVNKRQKLQAEDLKLSDEENVTIVQLKGMIQDAFDRKQPVSVIYLEPINTSTNMGVSAGMLIAIHKVARDHGIWVVHDNTNTHIRCSKVFFHHLFRNPEATPDAVVVGKFTELAMLIAVNPLSDPVMYAQYQIVRNGVRSWTCQYMELCRLLHGSTTIGCPPHNMLKIAALYGFCIQFDILGNCRKIGDAVQRALREVGKDVNGFRAVGLGTLFNTNLKHSRLLDGNTVGHRYCLYMNCDHTTLAKFIHDNFEREVVPEDAAPLPKVLPSRIQGTPSQRKQLAASVVSEMFPAAEPLSPRPALPNRPPCSPPSACKVQSRLVRVSSDAAHQHWAGGKRIPVRSLRDRSELQSLLGVPMDLPDTPVESPQPSVMPVQQQPKNLSNLLNAMSVSPSVIALKTVAPHPSSPPRPGNPCTLSPAVGRSTSSLGRHQPPLQPRSLLTVPTAQKQQSRRQTADSASLSPNAVQSPVQTRRNERLPLGKFYPPGAVKKLQMQRGLEMFQQRSLKEDNIPAITNPSDPPGPYTTMMLEAVHGQPSTTLAPHKRPHPIAPEMHNTAKRMRATPYGLLGTVHAGQSCPPTAQAAFSPFLSEYEDDVGDLLNDQSIDLDILDVPEVDPLADMLPEESPSLADAVSRFRDSAPDLPPTPYLPPLTPCELFNGLLPPSK